MNEPILTVKALEDFKKWAIESYTNPVYVIPVGYENGENYIDQLIEKQLDSLYDEKLPEVMMLSLIQEWLDSIGLVITISTYKGSFYWEVFYNGEVERQKGVCFSRIEAHKEAILKANEIYNSKNL